MTKVAFPRIVSQINGWDAEFDDVIDIFETQPLPIVEYNSVGSLPTASLNDRSIAFADYDGGGDGPWYLYYSDGSAWRLLPRGDASAQTDLTDNTSGSATADTLIALTDPADTPATADALRDDLVANVIPDIRDNFATLAAEFNALLAALRATKVLAT